MPSPKTYLLGLYVVNLSGVRKRNTDSKKKMVPQVQVLASSSVNQDGSDTYELQTFSGVPKRRNSDCEINGILPYEETRLDEEDISDTTNLLDRDRGRLKSDQDEIDIVDKGLDFSTEKFYTIALQVFFPFLIAGGGCVAAGLLLDVVQHWQVFQDIPEIFILVPSLLGLKGNLEMTLASRLSTAANMGHTDSTSKLRKIIIGNLTLLQVQAITVASLAAVFAVTMSWVGDGKFNIHHATLLCASSLVTASSASFILGSLMVAVVVCSTKCKVNPDNVATPIAASLGDLTTLFLLSRISSFLFSCIETNSGSHHWIAPVICLSFFIFLPLFVYFTHHNHYTHPVLYSGWTPVISAMAISSAGGMILDYTVVAYKGIAVYNPVVNGVGGNLVAVQASRLSTFLHQLGVPPGEVTEESKYRGCIDTFFGKGIHAKTARVLLFICVPGHLIFLYAISFQHAGHTSHTPLFIVAYLLVGLLQVSVLLLVANWLVRWIWKRGKDPDNYTIPYLTALGDLLGTGLLAVAFHLLWLVGDRDSDVGE